MWPEQTATDVKEVKDFIQSKHMQDVIKQVNDKSTAPIEFIWLKEVGHIYEGTVVKVIEFDAWGGNGRQLPARPTRIANAR